MFWLAFHSVWCGPQILNVLVSFLLNLWAPNPECFGYLFTQSDVGPSSWMFLVSFLLSLMWAPILKLNVPTVLFIQFDVGPSSWIFLVSFSFSLMSAQFLNWTFLISIDYLDLSMRERGFNCTSSGQSLAGRLRFNCDTVWLYWKFNFPESKIKCTPVTPKCS